MLFKWQNGNFDSFDYISFLKIMLQAAKVIIVFVEYFAPGYKNCGGAP